MRLEDAKNLSQAERDTFRNSLKNALMKIASGEQLVEMDAPDGSKLRFQPTSAPKINKFLGILDRAEGKSARRLFV